MWLHRSIFLSASLEKKFRFRRFQVYRDAREYDRCVRGLVQDSFPLDEKFRLSSQLIKAADSIMLNIAEGAERSTDKDFANFLATSLASLNEVVACLDIALDHHYLSAPLHQQLLHQAALLGNQLSAFRKKLLEYPAFHRERQRSNVKG